MADRTDLRRDVEALLCSLETRPTSDIQLIWSWYGAGKTHTVYYLANQCAAKHQRLIPIYTELPREAKGFADLYRMVISQLPIESVIDGFLDHSTRPASKTSFSRALDPDLTSALTQAAVGAKPLEVLLNQWLLGNPLPASSLRQLGVGARINSTEKCAVILAELIALLAPRPAPGTEPKRVIWIIDEVQRVEELGSASHRSVLSGLVGVFNKCATGLTLLLSYTGTPKENSLPEWIPADLKDRIGLERPMLLPPLRSDEAMVLVQELLAHFRSEGTPTAAPFHPFERDAVEALVGALLKTGDLKPRSLMETLDACLRQLEPELRSGVVKSIGLEALKSALVRFPLDWSTGKPPKARKR